MYIMTNSQLLGFAFIKLAATKPDSAEAPWYRDIGGAMAAGTAMSAARHGTTGLIRSLFSPKSDGSAAHASFTDKIKNIVTNAGFGAHEKLHPAIERTKPFADGYHSAADMVNKNIYVPKGTHPGIWAHEAGHVVGSPLHHEAQLLGKLGGGLGAFKALWLDKHKDEAENSAMWAGLLQGAGTLPSEIDASARGFKMLKGMPLKSRMMAGVGLPTYAIGTLLPYLGVQVKDYLGGYSKRPPTADVPRQ